MSTTVYVDDHFVSDEEYLESEEKYNPEIIENLNQTDNSHGSKETIMDNGTSNFHNGLSLDVFAGENNEYHEESNEASFEKHENGVHSEG